ncbi:phosphotransferase [Nocardia sp. AG03]|uniref:phosphotransferase enzyme family protein n=1 Tax=Nocardia sp. AG03 TaxID=3025312 RepID=UPI0024184CE3|nr:phosphotransferase [Nocardia sp. AG03]
MIEDQVFGMGDEPLAAPLGPSLGEDEVARVVAATWPEARPEEIRWRSPRPLSSTVGVRCADGTDLVVKRLPCELRDLAALGEEHGFMAHLRARGIPVPEVRATVGTAGSDPAGRASDGHPLRPQSPGVPVTPRGCAEPGRISGSGSSATGPGRFVYEVQRAGTGTDRYRADFSWSPYRDRDDAAGAGAMLGRLHRAAEGFAAPARPARPLVASMHTGVREGFEWHLARRPAVARFLAGRHWRDEIIDFRADLDAVAPLWTHGDWHPTNLLWQHHQVGSVIDFGLADRTTAVFDLATAIERTAVDWVALRDGGPASVRYDQIAALLAGYRSERPLTPAERAALPDLLPLIHVGYELSEIDYFLTVAHDARAAEIAYHDWLLGHLRWYATPEGRELADALR